jgi:hypothetical protein
MYSKVPISIRCITPKESIFKLRLVLDLCAKNPGTPIAAKELTLFINSPKGSKTHSLLDSVVTSWLFLIFIVSIPILANIPLLYKACDKNNEKAVPQGNITQDINKLPICATVL